MPTDIVVKPKEWQTTIVATEIVMQWKVRKSVHGEWQKAEVSTEIAMKAS